MNQADRIVATIKTAVPALWGIFLAWAIAQIPPIGEALEWLTAQAGTDVSTIIEWLLTVSVIAAFYWLAAKVGARWPHIQKWLLGSSLVPEYRDPSKD